MTDRELDAFAATEIMGWAIVEVARYRGADREWWCSGPNKYENLIEGPAHPGSLKQAWRPTADLNQAAQAEAKIAEMGWEAVERYGEELFKRGEAAMEAVDGIVMPYKDDKTVAYAAMLPARARCEAMYAIREHITNAQPENTNA